MKDRNTGQPRGFGFVTYADASVVDRVIEETHIINGKQVGTLILLKVIVQLFGAVYMLSWFLTCEFSETFSRWK